MSRAPALAGALVAAGLSLACPAAAVPTGGRSPVLARHQRKLLERRALPAIGYVKVHKTGSSTMANVMNRLAYHRRLRVLRPRPTLSTVIHWRWRVQREAPRHQYDMINNHGVFDETAMRAYLRRDAVIFTMVREPLSVIDSEMRFHQKHGPKLKKGGLTWHDHLNTMVTHKNKWANPISRDLGWYRGLDLRRVKKIVGIFQNDTDAKAIEAFIRRIDHGIDLVLLSEHYDEGLLLLQRLLGLRLADVRYLRLKRSKVEATGVPPPTAEELERLKEFTTVDRAVYAHFSRRFWQAWDALGGDAALAGDLAELRAANDALSCACGECDLPRDRKLCPDEFLMEVRDFQRMDARSQ